MVLPLGFGHGFYLGELDENQVPTQNLRPDKKIVLRLHEGIGFGVKPNFFYLRFLIFSRALWMKTLTLRCI